MKKGGAKGARDNAMEYERYDSMPRNKIARLWHLFNSAPFLCIKFAAIPFLSRQRDMAFIMTPVRLFARRIRNALTGTGVKLPWPFLGSWLNGCSDHWLLGYTSGVRGLSKSIETSNLHIKSRASCRIDSYSVSLSTGATQKPIAFISGSRSTFSCAFALALCGRRPYFFFYTFVFHIFEWNQLTSCPTTSYPEDPAARSVLAVPRATFSYVPFSSSFLFMPYQIDHLPGSSPPRHERVHLWQLVRWVSYFEFCFFLFRQVKNKHTPALWCRVE